MAPDRKLPKLNDSGAPSVDEFLVGLLDCFPGRADYRFVATDGVEGCAPDHRSHAFPRAGYFVMRSGWERDANYLCFDAGPLGIRHDHQDKLNLVLWAYGRELLVDNGGGSY